MDKTNSAHSRKINFTGNKVAALTGFDSDHGLVFDDSRGYGWRRDLSQSHRKRNRVPESYRDTFIFTRNHDVWECKVPNGKWIVTVCVGDSGHEQIGQWVKIEGTQVVKNEATATGFFREQKVQIDVSDGRLTVEIGKQGVKTNTCLNWICMEPAE